MLRPSIIAAELVDGQATFSAITYEDPPQEIDGMPLLVARGTTLLPVVEAENSMAFLPGDRLLVLQRPGDFLSRSLDLGRVIDITADRLETVYERLLDAIVGTSPALSRADTMRALSDSGAVVPVMLGQGVAVPHCYSAQIRRHVCAVGRVSPPLVVQGQTAPLQLVFLRVSPAGDPEGHLATLSEIARFCARSRNREALLKFPKPEEARRFLRRHAYT